MRVYKEAREWGRKGKPDGTEGTVVGFSRYLTASKRFGLDMAFNREPGIYEKNGAPLVLWDGDSAPVIVSNYDINPSNPEQYDKRYKEEWVRDVLSENKIFSNTVAAKDFYSQTKHVSDLPDTQFWELDKVYLKGHWDGEVGVVVSINYLEKSGISYQVQITDEDFEQRSGQFRVSENEMTLVERGNVWRHYNGDDVVFTNLQEEAAFEKGLGRSKEIKNPRTQNYSWQLEEALEAIKRGEVDALQMSGSLFGAKPMLFVQKFDNEDLGRRLREETLKGFEGAEFDAEGELVTEEEGLGL